MNVEHYKYIKGEDSVTHLECYEIEEHEMWTEGTITTVDKITMYIKMGVSCNINKDLEE